MRAPASAVAALVAASCGGGQTRGTPFDPAWTDDHGAAMAAFERSFRGTRIPEGADVAVGVAGARTLAGVPLDGGAPWTFTHELEGRPAVAGTVVVAAGGGEIFALEARTGKLLWTRPSGGRIRGAGDDGVTTVVSIVPTPGVGSVILAVARDGGVVRQLEDAEDVGVPAVAGDAVFLPWQGRFLSVYDLSSGEERARAALPGGVVEAFTRSGAVFAGGQAVTRFDARIGLLGAHGATTVALPALPSGWVGDPAWTPSPGEALDGPASARDAVPLYARPAAIGPAAVDGGRFAGSFHRVALGFDAASGALAWAHEHGAVFRGGAAYRGGFALCDAEGWVTFFEGRTGAVAGRVSLGRPVDACLVQADAFAPR
jgi:outer membrane protein assembly factor BamB